MIDDVKNVVVLGASGTMGSLMGGLVAQTGRRVCFLSRTPERAQKGLARAIKQARSEVITQNIVCGGYDDLLAPALAEADWIVECVAENLPVKQGIYEKIDALRHSDSIVSSVTSSLPLELLVQSRSEDLRKHFLSTHFYNPPGKMLACETTGISDTMPEVLEFMNEFLSAELRRVIIPVKNTAAFAGNRIAFLLLNRIAALAIEHGVEMMDYLIGPYTGRLMRPLATLDLVGMDVYRAIMHSLQKDTNDEMHDMLAMPEYVNKMIDKGFLGAKTKGGFYKRLENKKTIFIDPETCDYIPAVVPHFTFVEKAKDLIHLGMYRQAFDVIKSSKGIEADIVREILCTYIAYSYARIGEVTEPEFGIDGINKVMLFGFNWACPSLVVDMFGGKDSAIKLLEDNGFAVPDKLVKSDNVSKIYSEGKYFLAK